jgi:beta-glucosidase-like glycosyl hydrolase
MIGHIIIPELDSTPSSISRPVLEKLRAALPFSDDLIFITDSLSMKGVGLPVGQAIVEAFLSGEDMVILEDTQETEFFDTLILLYQNGTLDIKRLDQSVYRILKIKSQFGKSMTSPQ